ncbi:MAG TPA: hypothetical protein DGG95_13425, partial [Cytophagales bacterium]|nr:hypothetical protein [Cytophagales bacterium]
EFGIEAEIEVTFPEVITQDRSAKLKDLATAEEMQWISHSRAAEIAAKELGISKYDWELEKSEIEQEQQEKQIMPEITPAGSPLTSPGSVAPNAKQIVPDLKGPSLAGPLAPGPGQKIAKNDSTSAITSDEKKEIKNVR